MIERALSDGRGLGDTLARKFECLNHDEVILKGQPAFADFPPEEQDVYPLPYVNGELFARPTTRGSFRAATRNALL